MPLKFSKLANFLEKNKLVITTLYVWRDYCKYIRAFSIDTGISFLISVNRDYHCKADENQTVYVLDKIKFSSHGQSVIEKFTSYPSDKEVKINYELQIPAIPSDEEEITREKKLDLGDGRNEREEREERDERDNDQSNERDNDQSDERDKEQSDDQSDERSNERSNERDKERDKEQSDVRNGEGNPKEIETKEKDKQYEEDKLQSETEEEKLQRQYKRKILLENVDTIAENKLKECVRQVKRLSYGLEDLDYSICIVDEKFFVTVDSSDEPIETYFCKSQKTDGKRLFFICISLENFYERKQKVLKEIKEIRQAIFGLLDKNSEYNVQKLYFMFSQLDAMGGVVQQIFDTKTRLANYIQSFQKLLSDIMVSERDISNQLANLLQEETYGKESEVSYIYKKQNLQDKLSRIMEIKQKILKNITTVTNENDNLYLKSDRCDFENIILLDAIVRNLKENEKEILSIKS